MTNPLALAIGRAHHARSPASRSLGPPSAISIVHRIPGAASAQTLTTDDCGRVTGVPGPADYSLARVSRAELMEVGPGQIEQRLYAATYVSLVYHP